MIIRTALLTTAIFALPFAASASDVRSNDSNAESVSEAHAGAVGIGGGANVDVSNEARGGNATGGKAETRVDVGQYQGQVLHTGNTSAYTGASTSNATTGPVTATTGPSSATGGNSSGQSTSFVDNSVYEATKRSAASAYAAPLQIGSLVCGMSKVSGAFQIPGAGASGSIGAIDQGCERRSTADVLARLGMHYEACLIMVSDPVARSVGLTTATCQREPEVVAPPPAPVAVIVRPPTATMAPIPNPVVVQDGERG